MHRQIETHGNIFAPNDRTGQGIPELYDTIEAGREKLSQSRMWTQRPQFIGMAQDGWAEAHGQGTDQNAIAGRSNEQL